MNFGQMQTTLMRYGFDTTDPLTLWLNAALHELDVAFDYPWAEEGPLTVQLAAGANTITVPTDLDKFITVRDVDHLYPLKYYNRHKFNRLINDQTDLGNPEVYTLIGQSAIQIWRVPVIPVNIELVYSANTSDMVNPTDVPTVAGNAWPLYMHMPIVFRAASIALQSENEEDRAKQAQAEYDKALMIIASQIAERELGDMTTVEDTQGYGGADMGVRGMSTW